MNHDIQKSSAANRGFTTSGRRLRQPRPYTENGIEIAGVLAVPLQKGKFMLIDAVDWPLVSHVNWSAMRGKKGEKEYAQEAVANGKLAHRAIMGARPGERVDHRNGDGLDNRRSNLRIATVAQNNCNMPVRRGNRSGYKGVVRVGKSYRARIGVDRKQIVIGFFPSPELAALAYDVVAPRYHGEFASLNFPEVL